MNCKDEKDSTDLNINKKRKGYLEWPDYFMAAAFLAAQRSKDPCSQVGACIVNENNVMVGVGYNGMPIGCSDDQFPWTKNSKNKLENKHFYVCHAELNAILNKNCTSVKNCTMYVGLFPCNECAKVIIQSGIKEVVYMSDKHERKLSTIAAKNMFDAVGIEYRQFIPKNRKIVIDFDEINWNDQSQLPSSPIHDNIRTKMETSSVNVNSNLTNFKDTDMDKGCDI
ncbi:deoxycytidylate deaminase [Euwallacea similis]|uniref:deoxycytidylate deaminase n=1 Tax=Euwallacea similis TaxID=1736056 RepID=UPI00344E9518